MKTAASLEEEYLTKNVFFIDVIEARDAEWRRLVEEAQALRDAAYKDRDDVERERASVAAERDRLKRELVQARWLHTLRGGPHARCHECMQLAATPAEQAQPCENAGGEGLVCDECDAESPAAASCRFRGERAAAAGWRVTEDGVLCPKHRTAEQAQGEGAKPKTSQSKYPCQFDSEGRCEWHVHDDKPLMLATAALAKRVDALDIVVEALNEGRRVRDWPAPPVPESAAPGADDEAVVREIAGRHYDGARSFAVMWQAMQAAVREAYAAVPAAEREACIAIARDGLDGASPCAAIADAIARRGGK